MNPLHLHLLSLSLVFAFFATRSTANAPQPSSAHPRSTPLAVLEGDLATLHAAHQASLHSRLDSMDRSRAAYSHLRSAMSSLFSSLPTSSSGDLPLHLSNINDLRRAGYRFSSRVDPGLSLPFGTRWEFTRHGPYPSTLLAQGAFDQSSEKVRVELENAREALDQQTMQDANGGMYRGVLAFTDDVGLLKAGLEYHARRISEEVKRGARVGWKALRVA